MPIYQDKKRKTWQFRTWVKENGVRHQVSRSGFLTKSEARKAEIEFVTRIQKAEQEEKTYKNMSFQDLYNVYIKSKSQNLKPESYRALVSRFKLHILPFFNEYHLNDINNELYLEWKSQILEKNFSFKYNSSLHGSMVNILNYAIDFYDLDKNIASKVGNFPKKNYMPKVNFWTMEEFQNFISVVDDNLYNILFRTLFFTGMRIGECLALTWNDFSDNSLNINKTLAKGKLDGNYIITSPKTTTSIRKILLDDETCLILKKLKESYQCYVNFSNDWFIFGGLTPLAQTTVNRRKNNYCKLSDVKVIRIHDFRHSHATFLLSKGVPVTVISKRLGHKDITMTLNTYSHLIPEDENKAVLILNEINEKKGER